MYGEELLYIRGEKKFVEWMKISGGGLFRDRGRVVIVFFKVRSRQRVIGGNRYQKSDRERVKVLFREGMDWERRKEKS